MIVLDLPQPVLSQILNELNQNDTLSLSYTSKASYRVCIEKLYRNIYITERTFPLSIAYKYLESERDAPKLNQLHKWTIVHSSLRSNSPLKLLERTLQEEKHRQFSSKIGSLICDDITFTLFKLNSWNRRFQLSSNLQNFYIANVPLNHLMTVYEDLGKFYKSSLTCQHQLNLKHIQLFNFNEFVHFTGMFRLKSLSFYLCDLKSLEIATIGDMETKRRIVSSLRSLESLEIVSTHNLSLNFLENLQSELKDGIDSFEDVDDSISAKLFPNVHTLSFNHTHGQTNVNFRYNFGSSYDLSLEKPLDITILNVMFDLNNIKQIKNMKIGCTHIQSWHSGFEDMEELLESQHYLNEAGHQVNDAHCNCLESFLNALDLQNVESFSIVKEGHSTYSNPFSLYYFRHHMIELLKTQPDRLPKLKHLSIDTQSSIYPFYDVVEEPRFKRMAEELKIQSDRMISVIRNRAIAKLQNVDLVDYYESVYIWEIALQLASTSSIINCTCTHCLEVNQRVVNFLKTNKKIQFYLNPTSLKTFHQYYFDLIAVILQVLRNEGRSGYERNKNRDSGDESVTSKVVPVVQQPIHVSNKDDVMSIVHTESVPWRKEEVSLHSIFKHDSYKEMVNYNFVRDLSRALTNTEDKRRGSYNPYEIKCTCQGNELEEMVEYIRHQIIRSCESGEEEYGAIQLTTNSLRNRL